MIAEGRFTARGAEANLALDKQTHPHRKYQKVTLNQLSSTKLTVKVTKLITTVKTDHTPTLTDIDTHPDQPLGSAGQHREQRYNGAIYCTPAGSAGQSLRTCGCARQGWRVGDGYSQALMQV